MDMQEQIKYLTEALGDAARENEQLKDKIISMNIELNELRLEVSDLEDQVRDLDYLIERNWEDYQRDIRQLEDELFELELELESDLNDQSL